MAGLLCHTVLLLYPLSAAFAEPPAGSPSGNARLLTTDEAAVIEHPVLGLQRSAVPLGAGLALDTSVYADLFLAPNLGLRMKGGSKMRAAGGVRYGGEQLGVALGAAYVDIEDPAFPGGGFSVLPVFDLTWTFR